MQKANKKLAAQLVESLIVQEMKQIADSIARIKAKRLMPSGFNANKNQKKIPYLFRKRRFRPVEAPTRRR